MRSSAVRIVHIVTDWTAVGRWRTVLVHEVKHVLSVANRKPLPFGRGTFQFPLDIGLISH